MGPGRTGGVPIGTIDPFSDVRCDPDLSLKEKPGRVDFGTSSAHQITNPDLVYPRQGPLEKLIVVFGPFQGNCGFPESKGW